MLRIAASHKSSRSWLFGIAPGAPPFAKQECAGHNMNGAPCNRTFVMPAGSGSPCLMYHSAEW